MNCKRKIIPLPNRARALHRKVVPEPNASTFECELRSLATMNRRTPRRVAPRKSRSLRIFVSALMLSVFLFIQGVFAQSRNTAHTLKLDRPENMPVATIDDVAWIAGHFQGEAFGGKSEEIWSPPLGGAMMGMFKIVRNDTVVFYEFLTIAEESNSLVLKLKHFHSDLKGWEKKDEFVSFPLVKLTKDSVFFGGLTFQKIDRNTLQVYLALSQNDEIREVEFKYNRVTKKEATGT